MIPGSSNPLMMAAAPAGGYQVSRSLRFNSADSAYLSRTPAVAGDRKTWTWAGWVKRSKVDSQHMFFRGGTTLSNTGIFNFQFLSTGELRCDSETTEYLRTTQVFRDPSAWYHIVIAFDVTQGTNANKLKLYVNGSEITAYSIDARSSLSNQDYGVNQAQGHVIGAEPITSDRYLNGCLADIHFISGQALTPSSFTEVSATTGQLIPKAYTGSFGTNGFWLKFSDNSAATAATLGKDYSGNSNNWTPNNLSVTAGAGNDSLVDTPTSYGTDTGVGGEVRGNYCTFNPISEEESASDRVTVSNGNLDWVGKTSGTGYSYGTIGFTSGKFYYEYLLTSQKGGLTLGFSQQNASSNFGVAYASNAAGTNGEFYLLPSYTLIQSVGGLEGSILGFAIDATNKSFKFYKDGVLQFTYSFSASWNGTSFLFPLAAVAAGGSYPDSTLSANFGQRAFAYTAPSGFKALCDTNLGAPLVAKPDQAFGVLTYSGNGSARTLTGLNQNPDLIWIKSRSAAQKHVLVDSVRTTATGEYLASDSTQAEGTGVHISGTTNGITIAEPNASTIWYNDSNNTYVAWCWDAGTSTVSNTAGSITSQVRANVSAGFSVVGWTSNGTFGIETTGHGLGVSPDLIIVKNRDSGSDPWQVFHSSFSNTASDYLFLNTTAAKATSGATIWTRSSTTFGYRQSSIFTNGQKGIAYCFAAVVGYSSFGSYTGNGLVDGPFVYTGMRPRWVLIKKTSATGPWIIYDAVRNTYNAANNELRPNTSEAENGGAYLGQIDILSNGFKIRSNNSAFVGESGDFVYACFAESPFAYARAR